MRNSAENTALENHNQDHIVRVSTLNSSSHFLSSSSILIPHSVMILLHIGPFFFPYGGEFALETLCCCAKNSSCCLFVRNFFRFENIFREILLLAQVIVDALH